MAVIFFKHTRIRNNNFESFVLLVIQKLVGEFYFECDVNNQMKMNHSLRNLSLF